MATKAVELKKMKAGKGCLGKAAAGEPIFILRSSDKFAPEVIRDWCMKVIRARHHEWMQTLSPQDQDKATRGLLSPPKLPKVDEARKLAKAMEKYATKHGSKVPD